MEESDFGDPAMTRGAAQVWLEQVTAIHTVTSKRARACWYTREVRDGWAAV
jgi:hypothetical protein